MNCSYCLFCPDISDNSDKTVINGQGDLEMGKQAARFGLGRHKGNEATRERGSKARREEKAREEQATRRRDKEG